MNYRTIAPFLLAIICFFSFSQSAQAAYFEKADRNVTLERGGLVEPTAAIESDAFLLGSTVTLSQPVMGDVFVAGNNISTKSSIERSAFLAGSTITSDGGVAYNLFVAGYTVTLSGHYGRDVYVAGGKVILLPGTVIAGDLRIHASEVVLDGEIGGLVQVSADSLTSHATIKGDLTATVTSAAIASGSIAGKARVSAADTQQITVATSVLPSDRIVTTQAVSQDEYITHVKIALWWLMAMLFFGLFLIWQFGKRVAAAVAVMQYRYWLSLLVGFAAMLFLPVVVAGLIASSVGVFLGLFIATAFMAVLVCSGVVMTASLGVSLVRSFQRQTGHVDIYLSFLIGSVLISLIFLLPTGIAAVILFIVAVGAGLPAVGSAIVAQYRYQTGSEM